jgi:RimJ/RimL family protein N-acetyltransferase
MKAIRTPRLILKPLTVDDISSDYIKWLSDSEVNKYLESRFQEHDYQSCVKFLKKTKENGEKLFGVFTVKENKHIGNCKLYNINKFHHTAEIGFLIGNKTCWGRGYATEVVSHVVDYGFKYLGLEKITAGCYESNRGSRNVLLKAGFEIEGLRENQVIFENYRQGVYLFGIVKK